MSHRLSLKFHKIKTIYNLNRSPNCGLNSANNNNNNQIESTAGDSTAAAAVAVVDGDTSSSTSNNNNNNNSNNNNRESSSIVEANLLLHNGDLQEILAELDHYTLDWRKHAIDCLRLISESSNCTNIIITKFPLVIALGHLLCLGLGQFFDIDQVYSASKSNKEACLKRIRKRFGASNRCSYIIVGDRDDVNMAKRLDLPSWNTSKSDGHRQLLQLYTALKEGFLM